jgi:AcrR family transcriptional regulator
VTEVKTARRYTSPLRDEAVARTRRLILTAAKELFMDRGYLGTTIDQIAERAGVSKPTVFANVGNKRTVLKELYDETLAGDAEPVAVIQRSWYQEALTAPDAQTTLRLYARNVVQILLRVAELEEVIRNASAADPELREVRAASEAQRRVGAATVVDAVSAKTPLKAGIDRERAIDILWTLNTGDPYRRLVGSCGWSPDRYQHWLADLFCDQLLGTPPGP